MVIFWTWIPSVKTKEMKKKYNRKISYHPLILLFAVHEEIIRFGALPIFLLQGVAIGE